MVYYVYASEGELAAGEEPREAPRPRRAGGSVRSSGAARSEQAPRRARRGRRELKGSTSATQLGPPSGAEAGEARGQHGRPARRSASPTGRAEGRKGPKLPTRHPAPTTYADLPVSERRLGNEAVKAICDRGRTHNRLLAKARASVDTSEPTTRRINRWHEKLKARDPMPELDLPKDVKLHSSWQQLAEIKWRKDWHERLMSGTKSNLDMQLPRHVKVYQKRKRQELRRLLSPTFQPY